MTVRPSRSLEGAIEPAPDGLRCTICGAAWEADDLAVARARKEAKAREAAKTAIK